jgi:hypothetical protein
MSRVHYTPSLEYAILPSKAYSNEVGEHYNDPRSPSGAEKKELLHLSLRSQSKLSVALLCECNGDVSSCKLILPTHVSSELHIPLQICYTLSIHLEEIRLCLPFRQNQYTCTIH